MFQPDPSSAADATSLYDHKGNRKYLNAEERARFLSALVHLPSRKRLFVLLLFWTGARISEVLALRQQDFQTQAGIVTLRTLKRRRYHLREIPLPPDVMAMVQSEFSQMICAAPTAHLFLWSRSTGWRMIKAVMDSVHIHGPQSSPRGLRHGFAIAALQSGIPLTLVQRWLGHSRLSTTAIYAAVTGPEELAFAARLWKMVDLQ